ncbi:surface-adhesin E family protein [uncultured Ramlibacter sp.]|uniref:surface-adhesin E family protein n=1 Tax=uncultured Ramlibacter sp. TaxID=260755 RepID=UPI00261EEE4F|nr:surface-adhesin E family protein [uncultured Ramlibacter sp.]
MRFKRIFGGVLVAAICCGAHAGWTRVGQDEGGSDYYDPSSVKQIKGIARLWEMSDMSKPLEAGGDAFRSMKAQVEYDCSGERRRMLHMVLYRGQMGNGTSSSMPAEQQWKPIVPGTTGARTLAAVCK